MCIDIPEVYLPWDSQWIISALVFSCFGILLTLTVLIVYLKFNNTPVVKASGRELSYVLLLGALLCHLMIFLFLAKPSTIVCAMQEFMIGFNFSTVYSALLTKTNRISRIFNNSVRTARRPKFISPVSQLVICALIILIQVIINLIWQIIDPSQAIHYYPTRKDNLVICKVKLFKYNV